MISGKPLKALLRTLRDQGVVSYKHEGLEILLDPNFQPQAPSGVLKAKAKAVETVQEQVSNMIPMPDLTDEQWLLSTNMVDPDENPIN